MNVYICSHNIKKSIFLLSFFCKGLSYNYFERVNYLFVMLIKCITLNLCKLKNFIYCMNFIFIN